MEWTRSPTFLDTILHTIWMSFLLFTKLSSSKYLTGIRFALRISSPFSVDFSSIFSAILRRLRDQSLSSTKYFRIASSKLILASRLQFQFGPNWNWQMEIVLSFCLLQYPNWIVPFTMYMNAALSILLKTKVFSSR